VVKTGTIYGPVVAFNGEVILPYVGKQGDNWAYFPQELKKRIIRAFPVLARR